MKKISMALAAILCASGLMAQDFSVGVVGGTLGAGVELTTNVSQNVNVRGILSGASFSKSMTEQSVTYDGNLKLMGGGLLIDYYPFETVLRLSAGGFYNGTKASITGTPTAGATYDINGVTYTSAEVGTLSGEVAYKKVMPYIGIGFANPMKGSALTFGMDAGVMFGKASTVLTATGAAADPLLAADVAAERQKLEDSVAKANFYPYLAVSLAYRF